LKKAPSGIVSTRCTAAKQLGGSVIEVCTKLEVRTSQLTLTFHCNNQQISRVGILPWQKEFLPGQWKKTVKTGNKFSTLNCIEILWCNYNASLNH